MIRIRRRAQTVPYYELIDLGLLPGGTLSLAWSINNHGEVVGEAVNASGKTRGFLWRRGQMVELGTLGGNVSTARSINDEGKVVGYAATNAQLPHACMWWNGQLYDLGLTGIYSQAWAMCISNQGKITGYLGTPYPNRWRKAFVYTDRFQLLPFELAYAVNDNGWVVGASNYGQAVLYLPDGSLIELGTFGGNRSAAIGLNRNGQVVGWAGTSDGRAHAFLWQNNSMIDLGTLPGYYHSTAVSINSEGVIVGWAMKADTDTRAVMWYNGQIYNLSGRVLRGGQGWVLRRAHAINDVGQIVGYGFYRGRTRAFLLNPLP